MAKLDVQVVNPSGYAQAPTLPYRTDDRTTSSAAGVILPGEPVKKSNSNFGIQLATGDPEIGTDLMLGIAATTSTETSTVEGVVDLYQILPGLVFQCKATTVGNIDTDAELKAVLNNSVAFDLTASAYTVDEDETDDPDVHGLIIIDGDIIAGTLDFIFNYNCVQGGGII